ncbi:MAG: DUF11 domain-containing protein [Saprospirales bacterium]|nr:DUF11 domain-containing protein [Saprospirales bacterium]
MLSKSVSPLNPNVGQTVTFTITVTNLGPDAATGVAVRRLSTCRLQQHHGDQRPGYRIGRHGLLVRPDRTGIRQQSA